MKEVEISIKGLFFYIFRHWKSIAVAMVVGAASLGMLQMAKNSNSDIEYSNPKEETLTDSERVYVESVYDSLEEMRSYNNIRKDSIIMSLDPECIAKIEITYMISVDDPYNMEGIEQAYRNYMCGSEFYGYISDITGLDYNDALETVSISYERSRNAAYNTALKVIIISSDKSGADEIAKVVNSYVSEKSDELFQNGYEHELTEIGYSIYQGPDVSIKTRQIACLQEIQSRAQTIFGTENSLTDEQKIYYESLVKGSEVESAEIKETVTELGGRPSVKYIVLGLMLGAFMMCGIYFMIYVLANRLDEEDDVESMFGTYLIGTITGKDYGKAIHKLQHLGKRTFDFDESVKILSTKIKMPLQKDGVSKIGILGCGIKKYNEKAANDIIATLKNDGIEVVLIDDPIYDPASAEKLSGVERVVILEKAGITYRTEIWKEIEMIKMLGIKIEGLIISE